MNNNAKENNGDTSLYRALRAGKLDNVELLLEKGADINININGDTPLYVAIRRYYTNIVELLLEKGADINIKNIDGDTPLHVAIWYGSSYKLLLEKGADINIKNNVGDTPLYCALREGKLHIAKLLLEKGADINIKNNVGDTPLYWALREGKLDIVELLLEKGADINIKNNIKDTPLYFAIRRNYLNIAELLLEKGADINIKNIDGDTPLHWALKEWKLDIAELLLEKGADINIKNNVGDTPLHVAIWRGFRSNIAKLLLEKGADINIKNNVGLTPLFYGEILGNNDLLELLDDTKNILMDLKKGKYNSYKIESADELSILIQVFLEFDNDDKKEKIKEYFDIRTEFESIEPDESECYIRVFRKFKEWKVKEELLIDGKKPEFFALRNSNHTTYMYFKIIPGITLDAWEKQSKFIEDTLQIPIDIELYDKVNPLYDPSFSKEDLIVIKESVISVLPDLLKIGGKYLKTIIKEGYKHYYFTDVPDINKWFENRQEIAKFIGVRVDILQEESALVLKESVENAIPKLLDLKDSHNTYPKLYFVQENSDNKTYFYTFLPEIDLKVWKDKARSKNFRTLFNEPDKVYKLEIYDKTNKKLYNEDFYTGQLIVLQELAKIPSKDELKPLILDTLREDSIFFGYATGSESYYIDINSMSHMMIIGGTGSGKSNLMNGVILSLLNSILKIQKLYLIDLKSGIEFNRYNELNSQKVEVFGRGTKPIKLLEALYEVEAEMYLREEYMVNNSITKIDRDPIFVIIDEFAQIDLMYAKDKDDRDAKDEIFNVLLRIGTRARSANIKLFVQTQDPRSVSEDLKKHLMSRVLLKTGKENDKDFTLQNPDLLMEYGINHINFDKGRYVFEDYNDGDTIMTELQFPFLDPVQNLHFQFRNDSQINDNEDSNRFKQYVDVVMKEYEYLKNTKILGGVREDSFKSIEDKNVENIVFEDTNKTIGDSIVLDEFDFDSLLGDETEDFSLEITEIHNTIKASREILDELNKREQQS